MNTQKISPQGYNLQRDPLNENPFWEREAGGGNVPAGGTAGQVLTKRTDADYDTEWKTPEAGGGVDWPEGGADGDLLVKSGNSAEWETPDFPSNADLAAVEATAEAAATAAQEAKTGLTAETAARTEADTVLGTRIGAVETDLAGYKTATDADIDSLESGLADETAARTAADSALGGRIDGVESDLSYYETATDAELQTLNTEDARLDGLITAETEARIDADSLIREDLGADITAETTARTAADNELRALIADNTGDIETQGATISGINTRLTTAEGDIDSLETRVTTAETDIDSLETRVTAAEGAMTNVRQLPKVTAPSTGEAFADRIEDVSSWSGTGLRSLVYDNLSSAVHAIKWLQDSGYKVILPAVQKPYSLITLGPNVPNTPQQAYNNGSYPTFSPMEALKTMMARYDSSASAPSFEKGTLLAGLGYTSGGVNSAITNPISGGKTGQVLTKSSDDDYDWEWTESAAGSLPSGGSAGDLLAKTASGLEWKTPDYATTTALSTVNTKAEAAATAAQEAKTDLATEQSARWEADRTLGIRLTTAESDIGTLKSRVTSVESAIASSVLPSGGSSGDLLEKTSSGTRWKTPNYATTAQLAAKADADTVTGLGTRLTTAEGDIDALESRATRDEQDIAAAAALGTKALTVGKFVNLTMGALTAPDFVGLPWVWYDAGGIMHGFMESDADAKTAPDGWAQYYNGGGGSYVGTPVYFDTPLKTATTVLNNTTYGGTAGKLYFPTTGDMPTAISRQFSISGEADECYNVQVDVSLTSPDMNGYVFHGGCVTTLRRSTGEGYTAIVGGHFDVTAGNTKYYHAGGPDDFKIAIENRGNGNFTAYLGVNNSFINYLRSIVSTPYRFHVNDFRVSKLLGVLA